jgi:hypothetical protein
MDSDAEVMRYINKGIVKTPEETWEGIRRVRLLVVGYQREIFWCDRWCSMPPAPGERGGGTIRDWLAPRA